MSNPPETPEGIAFVLWIASLAAAYEPGNNPRVAALLDLYGECLRAADGQRKSPHEQGIVQ